MKHFVVIGQTATAASEFLLDDLPGSSGRLDVLLRCVRAALLFSHGLRRDTRIYLVLRGGPLAPRALRIDGAAARFIRPDERSLALLVKKTLAAFPEHVGGEFVEVRPGVAVARGDIDCVLADVGEAVRFVLEEGAPDLRSVALEHGDALYFLGDHLGIDETTRAKIATLGATAVSIGPLSLHSDDVIAIVCNELDRRESRLATAQLP